MKNIKIKHAPSWVTAVIIITGVVWGVMCFAVIVGEKNIYVVLAAMSFVMLLILSIIVDESETEITFGTGSIIKCKWMFYRWKIDIEEIKSVYYTISSHRARGCTWHSLDIIFKYGKKYNEKEEVLKTKIQAIDIAKCIENKAEDIPLMELYFYIEKEYPQKVKGYEKRKEEEL